MAPAGLAALTLTPRIFRHTPPSERPRLSQNGQGLVEYSLILVVMAVVCVVSLVFFGDQLSSLLSLIGTAV
jgi:Flp pilus assembly pilin Flp